MSFFGLRTFAIVTAMAYFSVGTVAVRLLRPTTTSIEFKTDHLKAFSETTYSVEPLKIAVPESRNLGSSAPAKMPVAQMSSVHKSIPAKPKTVARYAVIARNQISFAEEIQVEKIFLNTQLEVNLASLYHGLGQELTADAAAVTEKSEIQDQVVTKQASTEEPEFFDYSKDEGTNGSETLPVSAEASERTILSTQGVDKSIGVDNAVEEFTVDELLMSDYSKQHSSPKEVAPSAVNGVTSQMAAFEQPGIRSHEILSLEAAKKIVKQAPKVSMNTQGPPDTSVEKTQGFVDSQKEEASKNFASLLAIQVTGTDFKTTEDLVGFEVRPQDDLSETFSDYNSGSVAMESKLSQEKMLRSVAILKRGFAVTNTELILKAEASEVTIPLVSDDAFNQLLLPYASRGAVGAVLVELDESTQDVTLDVPYSKVLRLDENLKETDSDSYSYQLFVGVAAGNALLSFKDSEGETISKVSHVHEHELTFEPNYFEKITNNQVKLFEEDLLGREKTPMIISEEAVKRFATEATATKIDDHTFKLSATKTLLGGRQYLELLHQTEPVYVGFRDERSLSIPSENFMRFILSRFEGSRLGNRCLVQINLSQRISKVDVAPESVGQNVQTQVQILDADGKFYDSAGPKSEKIIVVGESQGSGDQGQDAKINFKVTNEDGSVQYFGSYCSPNTYLVEQL